MNEPLMTELNELSDMLVISLKEAHIFNKNLVDNKDIDTLVCNWSINTHRDYEDTPECNENMQDRFFCYFDRLEGHLEKDTWELFQLYKEKLIMRKRLNTSVS